MTYEEELKQMSNEELIEQVLFWRDTICDKRDQSKAELLSRMQPSTLLGGAMSELDGLIDKTTNINSV